MIKLSPIFLLFFALFLGPRLLKADEVVIIKAVSDSKKSFVLSKGLDDGFRVGQRRVFTTDKISLVAFVLETKHDMSLWQIEEPNAIVPFEREETVVLTSSTESIWSDIARLEKDYKNLNENKFPMQIVEDQAYYIARGSLSKGLSESTSETSGNQQASRNGYQLEGLFSQSFKEQKFDWALGVRYDRDSIIVNSDFTIFNSRLMLTSELQYNFEYIGKLEGNFYSIIGTGFGSSKSIIDNTSSTGSAIILPVIRFGFRNHFEDYCLLYEASLESLNTKEKFTDGTLQQSNIINSKVSVGVRF